MNTFFTTCWEWFFPSGTCFNCKVESECGDCCAFKAAPDTPTPSSKSIHTPCCDFQQIIFNKKDVTPVT